MKKIFDRDKAVGNITKNQIKFYDTDLDKVIDENITNIVQEMDEFGNIIFVNDKPSIQQKMLFLEGLGFTIK